MLLIEVPGRTGHILLQPAELESEIDFDTRSLGSHQRMKEKSASVAAKASAEKAAYEETYGFADQLSPRSRARAIAALNKVQGFGGEYTSRREAILGFVKQGAKIDHEGRFGRVLRMPSGSFWTEKDLTKTGMDFAAYMISSSGRRGRGRRAPGRTVDWNPQDLPVLTEYEVSPRFDPSEPYIVVGSYNPLHADEDYTRVTFDPARGIGQVPFNENINYIGFTVWMTPADFLRLNPVRQVPSKVSRYLDDALERGESLGPPFIDVKMDDEQPGGGPYEMQVTGHEGRGRMQALVRRGFEFVPMPVHVIPGRGIRARHLDHRRIQGATILSDRKRDFSFPWRFSVRDFTLAADKSSNPLAALHLTSLTHRRR